jgi:hypothetical protein
MVLLIYSDLKPQNCDEYKNIMNTMFRDSNVVKYCKSIVNEYSSIFSSLNNNTNRRNYKSNNDDFYKFAEISIRKNSGVKTIFIDYDSLFRSIIANDYSCMMNTFILQDLYFELWMYERRSDSLLKYWLHKYLSDDEIKYIRSKPYKDTVLVYDTINCRDIRINNCLFKLGLMQYSPNIILGRIYTDYLGVQSPDSSIVFIAFIDDDKVVYYNTSFRVM